jgi:hypothetical protein
LLAFSTAPSTVLAAQSEAIFGPSSSNASVVRIVG